MGVIMDCRFFNYLFFFLEKNIFTHRYAVVKIQFFGEDISWLLGMRKL